MFGPVKFLSDCRVQVVTLLYLTIGQASEDISFVFEDNNPCLDGPLKLAREELLSFTTDILERAREVFAPYADYPGDRFVQLVSRDLADGLLGLCEALYLQLCQMSGCLWCSFESDISTEKGAVVLADEAKADPIFQQFVKRFDMFLDIFVSAIELVEVEGDRRREDSELPTHREKVNTLRQEMQRIVKEKLAHKLDYNFLRTLSTPSAVEEDDERMHDAVLLSRNLVVDVHNQFVVVLELVPLLGVEGHHLPGYQHGWGVAEYLRYLQHDGTSRTEYLALLQGDRRFAFPFVRSSKLCDRSEWLFSLSSTAPPERPYRDASTTYAWHATTVHELLDRIRGAGHSLSQTYWAVRSAPQFGKEMACDAAMGIMFDVTRCLDEKGYGGSMYFVDPNPFPKYPERLYVQWKTHAWNKVRNPEWPLWKAYLFPITPPAEPMDVMSLSPLAGNCELLRHALTAESMTMARIVYTPINPVIPPPVEAEPNFTEFWLSHRAWSKAKAKNGTMNNQWLHEAGMRYILAQCSLARVNRILSPIGYELLHVQHFFAVFVHHSVAYVFKAHHKRLGHPAALGGPLPTPFQAWRQGWYCSPTSRYILDIEARAPFNTDWLDPKVSKEKSVCQFLELNLYLNVSETTRSNNGCKFNSSYTHEIPRTIPSRDARSATKSSILWRQRAVWAFEMPTPTLSMAQHLSDLNAQTKRAFCDLTPPPVCQCIFPYRGATCSIKDESPLDDTRSYSAAVVFAPRFLSDESKVVDELSSSLESLWNRFNVKHDYPIIIFDRGLSASAREKLALAAPHRVWFMTPTHALSKPLLSDPALATFDYVWFLASGVSFVTEVSQDPFKVMNDTPEFVVGFSRIISLKQIKQNHRKLWEISLLYIFSLGMDVTTLLDPGRNEKHGNYSGDLIQSIFEDRRTGDGEPEWNYKVFDEECHILKLSFFTSGLYSEYISFLVSHSGQDLTTYDIAAVQTLGTAFAIWHQSLVGAQLAYDSFEMEVHTRRT